MQPLSMQTRLAPSPNVEFRAVESGGILVNLESGACFQLNKVGAELWTSLSAGDNLESALALVIERYRVTRDRVTSDLTLLCQQLLAAGLLERR